MHEDGELERAAAAGPGSILGEWLFYLRKSGKWWLLPIALVLFALSGLVLLSGTPLGPFIYTLF